MGPGPMSGENTRLNCDVFHSLRLAAPDLRRYPDHRSGTLINRPNARRRRGNAGEHEVLQALLR